MFLSPYRDEHAQKEKYKRDSNKKKKKRHECVRRINTGRSTNTLRNILQKDISRRQSEKELFDSCIFKITVNRFVPLSVDPLCIGTYREIKHSPHWDYFGQIFFSK